MPLKLMAPQQVTSVLEGMERRGEIGHDWRSTWPWQKQVAVAHTLHGGQLEQYEQQMGRAQEWPLLGEEYGGPLRGGAGAWYASEPGHAPFPTSVFGTVTGWEPTEAGLRGPGIGAAKLPKRFRLSTQEYGLPVERPATTSWIRPAGGGAATTGAVVQTAFMHGLPPGAGVVSPAFPEIGMPFTKQIPITPGAQITAVARPGAVAHRGGALELLQTTQGRATIPVKDWDYMRLMGQPQIVPYSMPGRPEVTEAYQFQLQRVAAAQQGAWSQKSGMVKAFMGTGYDPQAMFGAGVEQILPWPKEPAGFMAQALGSPYGRQWYEQWAAGAGEQALPPGTPWQGAAAEQFTRAGEAFIQAHTQMRTFPMTVSEEMLGTRRGGVWTEKVGAYWGFMPKGAQPEPLGGGRYQIQQQRPVMQIPFLSQYRREHVGRPFVSHEELAQLSLSRPALAERLWQEGAGARQPYTEAIKMSALTRRGQAMGTPITQMPWAQIGARARAMMGEELGWTPEGQRIPGQYLARAGAEVAPGPMTAQFGGRTLQLPSFGTMATLGATGPLGEEVVPTMTAWHRMVERAAMVGMPGGMEAPGAKTEMRAATRQFWLRMKEFAGGAGVQREVLGTRPTSAWEGPILAHTGLRPGEEIWGDVALREATGARSPEGLAALKQQIAAGGGRGVSTTGWRRPISDPFGQVGGQGVRIMTEEMAREAGMDVTGLGRGVMTSPFTMFEQRGDVDADRMLRLIEQKVQWMKGKPVLGQLQQGIEAGTGLVRRIAGGLRLHAPEETPQGSALQQIFGSKAKWNEARAWMEEIQKMGRMGQVTEFFGGTRGQVVPWGDIAQATQMGLASKEAMGRTYNRLLRELRPMMTETATGRRAFRGFAAGPYQSAIDVTQLSQGARTYLAMHETLGTTPKGRGYGFAEIFSPYERTEEGGLRPRMSKIGGYGDIAAKAIGGVMGMTEVPTAARAYGIGGEQMHRQVQRMLLEKRQPAEIMAMMQQELGGVPETELLARGGPLLQSLAQKLYAKTPGGEVTYATQAGEQRTVQMPEWSTATVEAQALRAAGQRRATTGAVLARGRGLPVKRFEAALAGGMELTPEQATYMERASAEMGIGPMPGPAGASAYEAQRASDQPIVDAWNGIMAKEVRQKMAAMAPGGAGMPRPYATATYGAAPAAAGGGGGIIPPRMAPPGIGGGGAPPPSGGARPIPGMEWRYSGTWGPSGVSQQWWLQERQATGGHVQGLQNVLQGMARSQEMVQSASKGVVEEFEKLQKTLAEGGKYREEEVKQLKERVGLFKEARRVAQEWERQAKPTYGLAGTEEFGTLRGAVREQLGPVMAQVNQAQALMPEIGMRLGGVLPQAAGGGGGLGALAGRVMQRGLGGWGAMYLRRMWSMFGAPVQQAMGEYAGGQLQMQQAMYMGGLPTGMAGTPIEVLQRRAGASRFRMGIGEAGWQAWGGLSSPLQGEPGPLAPLAAIGGPALGVGLGAAYLAASGPIGIAAGLGVAGIGAAGYAMSAGRDQEAIAMAGAQAVQAQQGGLRGFGQWAWGNVRGITGAISRGWQDLPLWQRIAAPVGLARMGYGIATGQVGFQPEDVAYGQQIMGGNLAQLRDPEGRLAAMQYFTQQRLAPMLPGMEEGGLRQLMGGYMGMTGVTDLGQANMQLLQQAGQRAQMLGIQPGQAFQPFMQLAQGMGFGPTAGMALQLAEQAPWANERQMQQYLWQWGNVAPMMQQAGAMFGGQAQQMGLWQTLAGGTAYERQQMQQLLGGNRYLWSDIGRAQGRQELVTMEEGGLPIYTTEMRGIQDEMTTQQREYRDWRSQQQYEQMQENQQYIRAGWTIQDQQRQQQAAQTQWQFGYQQRAFAMQGTQWMEQYTVQGRQQMESMALGRQIFEARVGFQQQDFAEQQERQRQQYEWRMEDWAYGESRAQLQYGWQMEDLSEAIRYSSGRQRRQLMKQQERGTIMESMRREHSEEQRDRMEEQQQWQEEDFQQQRERNEELIRLQREQYDMQKRHWEEDREMALRHHEEDRELQEERMVKQREFYEAGKELDDERIALQREHQEEQIKWQIEAFEKAKEYNAQMDELQDAYRDMQRQQQDVVANFQRMLTYTEELSGAFMEFMGEARGQFETAAETRIRHEAERGHQAGGFIRQTERAMLHEGEYVVPAAGQLVVRGDNPESVEALKQIVGLITRLVAIGEAGKSSVIVVDSNRPQQVADHALSLSDEAWGVMPGA